MSRWEVLRDLEKETRGYVTGKGSIQFPHDKELPEEPIRRIVIMRKEEREREEMEKGKGKEKSAAGQEKSGKRQEKGAARPEGVYQMKFSALYPLYILKAEKKNRTREEVDQIIQWFTGYDGGGLLERLESGATLEEFFLKAPQMNPAADKINGVICGYRIEEITDEVMKMVRRLDKLIDELARGKALEKILNR